MSKPKIMVIVFLVVFLFTGSINCFAAFEDLTGGSVSSTFEENADFIAGPEVDTFYLDNVTGGIKICEGNTDKVSVNVKKSITAKSQYDVDYISRNMLVDADIQSSSIRIGLVTTTGENFWDWLFRVYPATSVSASFEITVPEYIQSYSTKVITGNTSLRDLDGAVASTITTGSFTAKNVQFMGNSSVEIFTGDAIIEEGMGSPEKINIGTLTGNIALNVNTDDNVGSVYAEIVSGNIGGLDNVVKLPGFITALTENSNDGADVTLKVLTGDIVVSGLPLKPVTEDPNNEFPNIPEFIIPEIVQPDVEFVIPEYEVPVFVMPELPEIEIPVIEIPEFVMPEIVIPVIEIPAFEMPCF